MKEAAGTDSMKQRVYPDISERFPPNDSWVVEDKARPVAFDWEDHSLYDELVGEPVTVIVDDKLSLDTSETISSHSHSFLSTVAEDLSQVDGHMTESDVEDQEGDEESVFTSTDLPTQDINVNNGMQNRSALLTDDDTQSINHMVVGYLAPDTVHDTDVATPVQAATVRVENDNEEFKPNSIRHLPNGETDDFISTSAAITPSQIDKAATVEYSSTSLPCRTSSESVSCVNNNALPGNKAFVKKLFACAPSCAVCSKVVYKMEEVLAVDKCWHKSCFRCGASSSPGGGCNQLLTKDKYESNKGVPYCKQCVTVIRRDVVVKCKY